MKKFLITLTVLFAAINIMAQEHLSFMGIPIEENMEEFCQKLEAKGFTSIGHEDDIAVFTGTFTDRDVRVGVRATDDGKNVCDVFVIFDHCSEWKNLVYTYNYYKDLYTRKYGEPMVSKENNPADSDSITALIKEKVITEYRSLWIVNGGEIFLSINDDTTEGLYDGFVSIIYRDSQNYEAIIHNYLEDI